jgi:hypothetical protein
MTRNLRALGAIAAAIAIFAATAASSAWAESLFTVEGAESETLTTFKIFKDDEGGALPKTAHIVIDIRKADGTGTLSITCNELTGSATVKGNTPSEATFITPQLTGKCIFAGQEVTVKNEGCNFTFTANQQIHLENKSATEICEYGQKPITFSKAGCTVEIPHQTLKGWRYHNVKAGGGKPASITAEATAPGVSFAYTAAGANCPYGTTANGLITTSNFLVRGIKGGGAEETGLSWDE